MTVDTASASTADPVGGVGAVYGGCGLDLVYSRGLADIIIDDPGGSKLVVAPAAVVAQAAPVVSPDWHHVDVSIGGAGADAVYGGAGDDDLDANTQNDTLSGGPGDDILDGQGHNDELHGGTGDDTLRGGAGDDHAYGGSGDDSLDGGNGTDYLNGGTDTDTCTRGATTAACEDESRRP